MQSLNNAVLCRGMCRRSIALALALFGCQRATTIRVTLDTGGASLTALAVRVAQVGQGAPVDQTLPLHGASLPAGFIVRLPDAKVVTEVIVSAEGGALAGAGSVESVVFAEVPLRLSLRATVGQTCAVDGDCDTGSCDGQKRCALATGPPSWTCITGSSDPRWGCGENIGAVPGVRGGVGGVRGPDDLLYAIGGYGGGFSAEVDTFSTVSGVWTDNSSSLPTARAGLAAVADASAVYAVGGGGQAGVLTTVEAFSGGRWAALPSLTTARSELAGAILDGDVYAIGGDPGGTAERYSPSAKAWDSGVALLAAPRSRLAAAVGADGNIYAVGGKTANGPSKVVEAYTASSNAWRAAAPLSTEREYLAAAAAPDGRVYAMGGGNGGVLPTVEAYTPASDYWTAAADLLSPRANFAAAVAADGRIFVFGGGDGPAFVPTTEAYGPTVEAIPTRGPSGTSVSLRGENFAKSAPVDVYLGPAAGGALAAIGSTDDSGGLAGVVVSASGAAGKLAITVVDRKSRYPATTWFTVTP